MRKYLIGGIAGFMLAISVTAHAEVSNMIGKVVDGVFPVTVSGKTLQNQAIVIEGTSYLPVREMADSVGFNVKFDADSGITLNKKITVDRNTIENALSSIESGITSSKNSIIVAENEIVEIQASKVEEKELLIQQKRIRIEESKRLIDNLEADKLKWLKIREELNIQEQQTP